MMLRVKNTALEPSKTLQIRQAVKLDMEPILEGGKRLRLRSTLEISEEWAQKNRKFLEKLYKDGVIEIEESLGGRPMDPDREPELNADGLKLGGPSFELWMERGFPAEGYPPSGWAEVPSAGLTAYRKQVEEAKAEEQRKGYEELKAKEEAAKAAKAQEDAVAAEMAKRMAEEIDAKATEELAAAAVEASRKAETAPLPTLPEAPVSAPAPAAKSDSKNPGKKLK